MKGVYCRIGNTRHTEGMTTDYHVPSETASVPDKMYGFCDMISTRAGPRLLAAMVGKSTHKDVELVVLLSWIRQTSVVERFRPEDVDAFADELEFEIHVENYALLVQCIVGEGGSADAFRRLSGHTRVHPSEFAAMHCKRTLRLWCALYLDRSAQFVAEQYTSIRSQRVLVAELCREKNRSYLGTFLSAVPDAKLRKLLKPDKAFLDMLLQKSKGTVKLVLWHVETRSKMQAAYASALKLRKYVV